MQDEPEAPEEKGLGGAVWVDTEDRLARRLEEPSGSCRLLESERSGEPAGLCRLGAGGAPLDSMTSVGGTGDCTGHISALPCWTAPCRFPASFR